jgi:hypothetical protein
MDAVLYLGPGAKAEQQGAAALATNSSGDVSRRLSFARAVCATYADSIAEVAAGTSGEVAGGRIARGGTESSKSMIPSADAAVHDIVSFSKGKVTWVEAWYALHPKKKITFSKAMCKVPPQGRLHCPAELDRWIAPCDDAVIRCSQSCLRRPRLKKLCTALAYVLTVTTVVEIGPVFPIVLYGCFLDDIALVCLAVMAAVVLLSQIPKRCCWRYRPFLDLRAVHMKTNTTSSFPSRAVICSVAYSYILAMCLLNGPAYFRPVRCARIPMHVRACECVPGTRPPPTPSR